MLDSKVVPQNVLSLGWAEMIAEALAVPQLEVEMLDCKVETKDVLAFEVLAVQQLQVVMDCMMEIHGSAGVTKQMTLQ